MCQMLLSIRPQYVDSIISGKKKYEYRKFRCREDVESILIYETTPTQRVIGEVIIEEVLEDSLESIWDKTKKYSGISKDFFDEYYKGKEKAYAYRLGKLNVFSQPKKLMDYGIKYAPQSFRYLNV